MIFQRKAPISQKEAPAANVRRQVISRGEWVQLATEIAEGRFNLISLWSDGDNVFMAFFKPAAADICTVQLPCPEGHYPSVGRHHPPAIRLERTVKDLFGLIAEGSPDNRPWLDHGRWGVRHPEKSPHPISSSVDDYSFLVAEGDPLHQIPVGPVHAGIIEPGHFRFSANGETVVRLEERLGFVHKGIGKLIENRCVREGARLAARVSGDSSAAYGYAFSLSVENALKIDLPEEINAIRALVSELERLANHFGDIGAICNDAAFPLMQGYCAVVRENILRCNKACFGHRLLMDVIVPGGLSINPDMINMDAIRKLIGDIKLILPRLIALYGDTSSLQDRTVGTGVVGVDMINQYSAGGVIGRASGRTFDTRRDISYGYYKDLDFVVGGSSEGDVDARIWVRFDEIKSSINIIDKIVGRKLTGSGLVELPVHKGKPIEGLALVEGFRGDIFCWVRVKENNRIDRCHLRDPSWFQWPLLEYAIKGNIVADFPLCNKSFNCSYSGHDL